MNWLYVGITALLTGIVLFEYYKRKDAEALNQNTEVKQEVSKIDQQIAHNQGLLDAEKQKQDDLKKQIEGDNKDVSEEDLLKYFNDKRDTSH